MDYEEFVRRFEERARQRVEKFHQAQQQTVKLVDRKEQPIACRRSRPKRILKQL